MGGSLVTAKLTPLKLKRADFKKLTPLKLKRADFKNTAESQSVSIYVKLGGSDWIPDAAAGNERS